jgi:peroxin-5
VFLLGSKKKSRSLTPPKKQSVLELEATVQRDPTNAGAWFELGVKQQENEREQKAIQALKRAIEIDRTHLPSWLALAVSYTNDGNRAGTYDAIREWVGMNGRYEDTVVQFRRARGEGDEGSEWLIGCLIAMAQSGGGDDGQVGIDADVQVALAILLNTNEVCRFTAFFSCHLSKRMGESKDYEKARDCFRTALELRPDVCPSIIIH